METSQANSWLCVESFIPKPSPMYTVCDHINRDTMDPRLINLRWSNAVLNMMNRTGVRGYRTYRWETEDGPVVKYQPSLTLLGRQMDLASIRWPLYWPEHSTNFGRERAYEVIDALCSHNIHWKIQRRILAFWAPFQAQWGKKNEVAARSSLRKASGKWPSQLADPTAMKFRCSLGACWRRSLDK